MEREPNDPITDLIRAMWYAMTGIMIGLLVLGTCSCKSYVAVPEYHYKETVKERTDTVRDSIYHYDSVWVETRGDTVYQSRYRVLVRDRWRSKVQSDTVVRVDSIRVPYPVERSVPRWQQAVWRVARPVVLVFFAVAALWIAVWVIRRTKR